jgi:hypothetical protein
MVLCRDSRHFRGLRPDEDRHFTNAFINRLYFVLTTVLTIGYGDITPRTLRCRIITCLVILSVFLIVLKAFDKFIDNYNANFKQYIDPVLGITPPPAVTT